MSSPREPIELKLIDPAVAAHPQPVYGELREQCPVHRVEIGGGDGRGAVLISSHEYVQYALRHPEIFSSGMASVHLGNKEPLIPLQVDPPEHVKYRKLLDPMFSRKRVAKLEPQVTKAANQLIDEFIGAGRCEFNSAFAIPFPCTVFLRLFGLPVEDLDLFLKLKDGIIRPEASDPDEVVRIRDETGGQIHAYFERAIEERLEQKRDDLLSYLVDAEIEGKRLSRAELHGICYLFLLGGLDTVTASLGCSISYLAQHPEQRRRLVEDPSLIPSAVEEMLRWETPVTGVARVVARDTTLGGVELHAGEPVSLLLGAADTDGAAFTDPDRVDFDRRPNPHFAFGGGPHRCLGSHLARMELRVAFTELHRRIPEYSVAAGETPRYSPGIREVQYLPLVFQAEA